MVNENKIEGNNFFLPEASSIDNLIEVTKILPVSEAILEDLMYWIKKGTYGNVYDGKRWIRNTQEALAKHLGYSRSHTKRGLKQCQDLGLIEARCFSWNKRNRELSYTIVDEEKAVAIQQELKRLRRLGAISQRSEKSKPYKTAQKVYSKEPKKPLVTTANDTANEPSNELSNEPMYIYQDKIHKSYKSESSKKISAPKAQVKSLQERNEEMVKEVIAEQIPKEKPNTVQRMVKSLENIFPGLMKTVRLTKAICRNLVAAFQRKFHNSIEEWERYLKLIATSPYLNSEKFKLSVYWILKFITIDRILGGEFGINPDKITYTKEEKEEMVENKKQQIQQKIDDIKEPETCKQARVKVLDILGADDYHQYFENPDKCRFTEKDGEIVIELLGSEPWDFIYKAQKLEKIDTDSVRIKIEWISDCVEVVQENGYKTFYIAKSFDELEKRVQNKPLWKRIFQASELEDTVLETQADCISNTCISDTPENFGFNIAY